MGIPAETLRASTTNTDGQHGDQVYQGELTFIDTPEITRDTFAKVADDHLELREAARAELSFRYCMA